MFGYACDETDDLMPMPIWLAHKLAYRLSEVRKSGTLPYLRPDGKTQVTDRVRGRQARSGSTTVLISTQHGPGVDIDAMIKPDLIEHVIRPSLPAQFADDDFEIFVNPTGTFELGGPHADCGLTGRKIIVDTYGGMARHGGGAFCGKDPTKVDRSAAYAARHMAKNIVAAGHRQAVRGAGRVRDRRRAPGVDHGRHVRHVRDRPARSSRRSCRRTSTCAPPRSSSGSTCAARSSGAPRPTATSVAPRRRFTWENTAQADALRAAAASL